MSAFVMAVRLLGFILISRFLWILMFLIIVSHSMRFGILPLKA